MSATLIKHDDTDSGWRWYVHPDTGDRYISVTTALEIIVEKGLIKWFKSTSQAAQKKKLKTALNHGSKVHQIVENDSKGIKQDIDPEHLKHLEAWHELKEKHSIKVEKAELPVHSDEFGYAGTLDMLGEYEGKRVVMDLKTGRGYSIGTGHQLAAYKYAYELMSGETGLGMVGIHIPSDGRPPKTYKYKNYDYCFRCFIAALQSFEGRYWKQLKDGGWPWVFQDRWEWIRKEQA
jgi:hypothetical protein